MSGESPLAGNIVLKKTRVRLLVIFRLGRKLEMIGLWQSFCMSAKALQSQSTFVPHFSPWIPQSGMTRSPHPAALPLLACGGSERANVELHQQRISVWE